MASTVSLPQPPSLHLNEPSQPATPSMLYVYEHTVWGGVLDADIRLLKF